MKPNLFFLILFFQFYFGSVQSNPMPTPQWNYVGPGIVGSVFVMEVDGDDLYVGGDFTNAAGIPDADYIARWDGCDWHAVVPGLDGCVNAIVFNGNTMYAGGCFTGHIGKLEGGVWNIIPGINGDVLALGVNATGLYAGGYFTDAGGEPFADGIARWSGSNWSAMGNGIGLNDIWLSIATIGTDVYVGGSFEDAGGNPQADGLARWNGSNWTSVGGFSGFITTIRKQGTDLYVGGTFQNAGGNTNADNIAKWDGSAWNNLGNGGDIWDYVSTLCVSDNFLYAVNGCWGGCGVQFRVYDFQSNSWDDFPSSTYWPYTMVQNGPDLFIGSWACCGEISTWRWGEPGTVISISGIPSSICGDAPPISLPTTQSGYTGNWSGIGVSNNIFNPASAPTWVDVVLTFNPTPGQCVSSVDFIIDVYLDYIILTLPTSICEASPPIALAPYQAGYNGNWSGPGVSNNMFDPSGINDLIFLTFTPTPGQCGATSSDYINVFEAVTPEISGVPPMICDNSDPVSLPTVQDGIQGNWSGQGVVNNFFDPSGLNGEISIAFTPDPGYCAEVVTVSITVDPFIIISISGVPTTICQINQPVSLPALQSGIQGTWSGQGINNNSFNPAGLNGDITLTFTPVTGSCADPAVTVILVYVYTPVVTGIPDTVCESVSPFPLPFIQSGFTGVWSGEGVLNNIFEPDGLDGVITLTFTPTAGQCALPVIETITVEPLILPIITGIPSTLCVLSPPVELPDIQYGISGYWYGPGVEDNYFNPAGLSGDIELVFTPDEGLCAIQNSVPIFVHALIVPLLSGVPAFVCAGADPQVLPILQNGISGTWSGPGVLNNSFNPANLNGSIELTFTPNPGECATLVSSTVMVDTSFIPVITELPTAVCQSDTPIPLLNIQSGFTGAWTGPGVSNNTFIPVGLNGSIQIAFIPDSNQCAVSAEAIILINTPVHPVLSALPDSLCQNDDPLDLSPVQDGITGSWIGTGVDSNIFNPGLQEGDILLSFVADNGACEDTVSTHVFIATSPSILNLSIECDSVSNTYIVSFDITGGNPAGYMVDGIPVGTNHFSSTTFPFSALYYSFTLEDSGDCGPVSIVGSNNCICSTDAGTMNFEETPIEICLRRNLTVHHNSDEHLDQDDLLNYILHDQPGNQLGLVYAVSQLSVMSFQPGMIPGQTYYVSAVAGSNTGNGSIDLHDPCLSVSPGVPVIFIDCEFVLIHEDPLPFDSIPVQPLDQEPVHERFAAKGEGMRSNQKANFSSNFFTPPGASSEIMNETTRDPGNRIQTMQLYDVWGRLIWSRKDVAAVEMERSWKSMGHEGDLIPGLYVFEMKIVKANGESVRYYGKISYPQASNCNTMSVWAFHLSEKP